jgi:exopolysaccharide production protein ExoQ
MQSSATDLLRLSMVDAATSRVKMTAIPRLSTSHLHSARSRWHYLAVSFFIMQSTGFFGVIDRIKYGEWSEKTGDLFTQSLNALQILVSIFLFWVGYNNAKRLSLGAALLLIVVAYLFMSVLWSVDPQTSFRRSIIYFFFALGVIGIANSLSGDEYLELLRKLVFLSAIASLVLLVTSPATALMSDGMLRGIFPHKNFMAQVMAAGVLASLHGMRIGGGHRRSCVAMIILFVGLAFADKSATSMMTILLFCAVEIILFISGRYVMIILAIVSIPVLLLILLSPDLILDFLGKDATLTGRTDLWRFVDIDIAQRPLLGWGFDAFWSPGNPLANDISANLGWHVPHAHNGLRELLLEVGVVGTSLFVIVFARNIWIATRCLRTPAKELGKTLLLCCGGILLVGISEEVLVDPSQISVGLLFVMGLTGERMLRATDQQQYFRSVSPPLRSASARGPKL